MRGSRLLRPTLWSTGFLEYLLRSRAFLPANYYAFRAFSTRLSMLFSMALSPGTSKAPKGLHLQGIRIGQHYPIETSTKRPFEDLSCGLSARPTDIDFRPFLARSSARAQFHCYTMVLQPPTSAPPIMT